MEQSPSDLKHGGGFEVFLNEPSYTTANANNNTLHISNNNQQHQGKQPNQQSINHLFKPYFKTIKHHSQYWYNLIGLRVLFGCVVLVCYCVLCVRLFYSYWFVGSKFVFLVNCVGLAGPSSTGKPQTMFVVLCTTVDRL